MSVETPPEGASCAGHPEALASWVCGRCGTFMCPECERRVRPEAPPMCPTCWDLRARTVNAPEVAGTGFVVSGLVLGVLSLVPMCIAVQIASAIVNVVALYRTREPPGRERRWMPVTGLVLTGVGIVGSIIVAVLGAT